MNGMFGLLGLCCGLYCLYAFYMLKVKKEITQTLLLPKDARGRRCSDFAAYSKEIGPPLLFLGTVVTLYGIVDLYNAQTGKIGMLFWVMFLFVWIALFWFMATLRKSNKKHFGM